MPANSPLRRCFATLRPQHVLWTTVAAAADVVLTGSVSGQPVCDCGSDGSDLALVVPEGQNEILVDPSDTARWGRVLDADGDGVYNFTTITVGVSTRLRLRGDKTNRPVHWLATGQAGSPEPLSPGASSMPVGIP
jgi:hypothetical protein